MCECTTKEILMKVIDRADVTFMQCNKDLHIPSPESNKRKLPTG